MPLANLHDMMLITRIASFLRLIFRVRHQQIHFGCQSHLMEENEAPRQGAESLRAANQSFTSGAE